MVIKRKQGQEKEAKETIRMKVEGGFWVGGTNMITSLDRWWNKAEF